MSFINLGDALKNRVKDLGLERQSDAVGVLKLAEKYIMDNFKGPLGKKLTPASFKNGVLTIMSVSAPAASEIKIYERDMLGFINRKLKQGEARVFKLKVLI